MNAESFANLLKEYAHLYQLPMEELRTMVMQYPYCHNLQVLLQEKSELDQHPDREKTLAKAATYAIDRKQLFKRLKLMREQRTKPKAEAYHLGEDFLELKDLSIVQADLEKIALGVYQDPTSSQTMAIDPEPPSSIDAEPKTEPSINSWNGAWDGSTEEETELDTSFEEAVIDLSQTPSLPTNEPPAILDPVKDLDESDTSDPELPTHTPPHPNPHPISPTPKKAFSSWSRTDQSAYLQASVQQLLAAEQLDHKKNKHLGSVESKNEVSKKAWQSIVDGDSMASETWAQLLVAQKQYHKAIEVYERLMLLIPEKSIFFAAQIESIKKSLST
ncbi:hypothetical protein [Haliscomenobacter hydrossis]|uniref:Uncharacterized protein n=1 Tax=Haliscomenobacter hydrossis (strain ATCC 27775 / DSM 1100 / LMG 10767 / O) TaxID=760192 RepID=F4KQ01_HALH1|nr:hypothetical protein [Haliscomenobacter hydrossis]AEE53205.1 hypothetical protein Halhy_5380 [Haliscomenobacter hydrossis DSM 1100]